MGLSIVDRLVKLLDGTISLESRLGEGSKFIVSVPVGEAAAESAAAGAEESAPQAGLRVLLVDDDPLQLEMTAAMCRRAGIGCESCQYPEYVAKLVGESRFDLVLTDLQMPSADGFGVLEAVRGVDPGLKVVAVSARGDLGAADFAARGFAGCLRKPFTYSELVAAIRAACGSGEIVPQGGDPEIPSADGADFTALTAYAGDDPEAARSILRSFAEQTAGNCAELERALGEGDVATVKTVAHKMLPIFTMLGAAGVAATLRTAESWEGPLTDALCGEIGAAAENIRAIVAEAEKTLSL